MYENPTHEHTMEVFPISRDLDLVIHNTFASAVMFHAVDSI